MRRYWRIFAALLGANVVLIWLLPVLPCQDLPQHLAYTRIFMDYARTDLRFSEFYTLPDHFEPYFSLYVIMAQIGKLFALRGALRIVMTLYAAGIFVSMHLFVHACRRSAQSSLKDPAWPALLSCLLVWSPTAALGLFPFMICVPVFFAGAAGLIGWLGEIPRRYDAPLVFGACVWLTSFHLVAQGCFVLFVAFYVALNWRMQKAQQKKVWVLVACVVLTLFFWHEVGGLGVGHATAGDFNEALSQSYGLDFLNWMFRFSWSDTFANASHLLWTILGPYRCESQIFVAIAMLATALYIRRAAPPRAPGASNRLAGTTLAFGIICWITPWGFYVPSEVTFINLRMMTLGLGLLIALLDPAWFALKKAQIALALFCFVDVGHFALRAIQFNQESTDALELIQRVEPNKMLDSIVFHSRTDYFGKLFRLTHTLPMYYTALDRGLNTQFWARYTDHLPIDYQPGKRPTRTPDWSPEKFDPSQLGDSDFLLVQAATDEDPRELREASERVTSLVRSLTQPLECRGLWCLYRLR
jgi:hypothetical protein